MKYLCFVWHCSEVIMNAMVSEITSLSTVCSTVCSGTDKKNPLKPRVTGLCQGNPPVTGGFPTQRDSNTENVSIRWRHYEYRFSSQQLYDQTTDWYELCKMKFSTVEFFRCSWIKVKVLKWNKIFEFWMWVPMGPMYQNQHWFRWCNANYGTYDDSICSFTYGSSTFNKSIL